MNREPAVHDTETKATPLTLRALREQREWTQVQLSRLTGLDQTTISTLELGKVTNPSYDTVKVLAREFDCSIDEMAASIRQSVLEAV